MLCLSVPHRIVIGGSTSSHILEHVWCNQCSHASDLCLAFARLCPCDMHVILPQTCLRTFLAPLTAGGSLTRAEQQDRIDFLAQARNHALEPLWLTAAHSEPLASIRGSSANNWAGNAHGKLSESFASKDSAQPLWQAQKVVFLNDVYFCAQDVLRWASCLHTTISLHTFSWRLSLLLLALAMNAMCLHVLNAFDSTARQPWNNKLAMVQV